jgi:hypothetical protein
MSNARDIADVGHQLVARVTFVGDGTSPHDRVSFFNVSSVTSTVTGIFTINFTNPVSAGYTVSGMGSRSGYSGDGDSCNVHLMNGEELTNTGSFQIRCHLSTSAVAHDPKRVCLTVFAY